MTRFCVTCRRNRSAALAVCPEDGTALSDVELTDAAEQSISIDISSQSPVAPERATDMSGELKPGTRVGDYTIELRIGAGGGGTVYRASHIEIGKRAAIKVIHFSLAMSVSSVQRFLDEARTVNAISHPSLIDIFAVGKLPDGRPYLVMELLEGRSLSMALRSNSLSMPEKLRIVEQSCVALEAAHAKGVVHRDLKPDNIFLVAEGPNLRLKLLDFGVAKLLDPGSGQNRESTRTGVVLGTPVYMAPEQILGDQIVPGTDVYALGVVLYRLFCGRPPFVADTTVELFMQHLQKAPPLPDELSPLVPMRLSRLMHQMLAKNPANRPSLTAVRAAAFATLHPNSKLAAALPPRRSTDSGIEAAPARRETSSVRWFGIGLGVVFASLMWFLVIDRPHPPLPRPVSVPEGYVLEVAPTLLPPPSTPPVSPAPVARQEQRPTVRLSDARVAVMLFPPTAELRVDQVKVATERGEAIVYASPGEPHAFALSAPGFIGRTVELTFKPEERRELTLALEAQPMPPAAPPPATRPKKPPATKGVEIIDPF